MSVRRAVCVATAPPSDTGAGGPLGIFGNGASVAAAGFEVTYVAAQDPEDAGHGRALPMGSDPSGRSARLGAILDEIEPDVVWIHHTTVWPAFAPLRHRWPHVLLSSDPEWAIEGLRYEIRQRPAGLPRKVVAAWRHARLVRRYRDEERRWFGEASERGIVAAWGNGDVAGMRRRTGVDVRWCALAFPDWGLRTERVEAPRALLLGHLGSTQTRHGIRYFNSEVWPAWAREDGPASVVRVVGGGSLPATIATPGAHPRLEWVGFAPSLDDEWDRATAMLVTVPLEIGFRTRIVEAWSKGVPVIAHPSAEAGLPQMRDGDNYLAATSGAQWVRAMRRLEEDPALAKEISRNARLTYETHFSIEAGKERFGALTFEAIERAGSVR